jgi:hypothetical protein
MMVRNVGYPYRRWSQPGFRFAGKSENLTCSRHIFLEIDTPPGISGLACTTTGQAKWQSDCGEQG